MDGWLKILAIIFGSLGTLGIFAGGLGYLVKTFRKGTKEEKAEVIGSSQEIINFWKSQAENYQLILASKEKDWNEKFQVLTREFGELKGKYDSEKVQNERLEKIFQNRDPESQKFMELVMKAIETQGKVNEGIVNTLAEIHALMIDEHNREMKVEATITKSDSIPHAA